MTIVQLEYLVALDSHRNFVKAAEKCFVTQPTLSMQIQKLEEQLGVILFDRSKQPVVPTTVGMEIIAQARVILNETGKLNEIISERKGDISGELKLGIIPTIAPYLLPQVIVNFMEKYPAVQLIIWEYTTEQIIQQLKSGLLDCGILSTPVGDSSLNESPLFYERFVTYISTSNELLKKKSIKAADIELQDVWLLNEGHCMRNQVLNICQRKKATGNKQFEYNTGSIETLKRMVDLNNGLTILPELAISDLTEEQLQRVRHFRSPEPTREISIVTHRNFLKRNLITTLQNEIIEIIPKQMRSKRKTEIMEIYT